MEASLARHGRQTFKLILQVKRLGLTPITKNKTRFTISFIKFQKTVKKAGFLKKQKSLIHACRGMGLFAFCAAVYFVNY
jgi:hypothetical protein